MLDDEKFDIEPSETLPAATDSNEKRAFLGILVGGIFFIGLVIAIIILILAGNDFSPNPPKNYTEGNPYFVMSYVEEKSSSRALIKNNRKVIEDQQDEIMRGISIKNTTDNFEPDLLIVQFQIIDEHLLNVKYTDGERERWEVTQYERDEDKYAEVSKQIRPKLGLNVPKEGKKFSWRFNGNKEGPPILSTEECRLQYFDKYVEFEARLKTHEIYGMGERVSSFQLKEGNYSLWNYDKTYEFGEDAYEGTFGSHPFFLNRFNKTNFIGVFMRNSNAMLFSFWSENNETFINYKMVGGIIDLSVFHAADAEYILRKYHAFIGRPYLPPFWALGFHFAREKLKLNEMKELLANHTQHWIPLDSFWVDTEITENDKTFTINNESYRGVKEFVNELHENGYHFVVMTNPGLKVEKGYKYYDMAINCSCPILSARSSDQPFEGNTNAGKTIWLDYYLHNSNLVWHEGLHDLYSQLHIDGVWISMNEPTQLCDGECYEYERPNPHHNETEFDSLPYRPTAKELESHTLPMAGYSNQNYFTKQFYTHNLFGFQVAKSTHDSLSSILEEKRFLVVSRSTSFGSGRYSSHWFDKNNATWNSLKGSISAMLNFNLFGIPHAGSPIGGFIGNAEEELLMRWYGVGAYSPLMLSYTSHNSSKKDVFSMGDKNIGLLRNLILERYKLIRFFYTKLFESHIWGGPAIHPLFFEFMEDKRAADKDIVETCFMWGKSLYIIPVVAKGDSSVRVYLPNWRWYEFTTLERIIDFKPSDEGIYYTFNQPLGHVTVLIKGGSIIPYQKTIATADINNANRLKNFPVYLIIAPDHTDKASGSMVVDAEGIKPKSKTDSYRHYSFTYMNRIFRINKLAGFDFKEVYETDNFWQMIILDVYANSKPSFACYMDMNYHKRNLNIYPSQNNLGLIIAEEGNKLIPMHNFESIVWGTNDQHNFCNMNMELTSVHPLNGGRKIIGELRTIDGPTRPIEYVMQASLLMNNLISFQLSITLEPTEQNWIVPEIVSDDVRNTIKSNITLKEAGFSASPLGRPFYFIIANPEDPLNFMFSSKNFPLTFLPNFIHLKLIVNGRHIFGLGERIHKFELKDGIYSIFSFDQTAEETGIPPGNNMWGSHPFYLVHLNDPNRFAAVLFLNSNPMDIRIRRIGAYASLDHIFTGGIIDSFFFWSTSVNELIANYQYIIGKPAAVPYWAFGYHQSKWGYEDIIKVKTVVKRFEEENIPLDGVWLDKDYMAEERNFVIDNNWNGLKGVVDEWHEKGLKLVILVDPGLAKDDTYSFYTDGLKMGVFVISSFTKEPLIGVSWPGYSVYIDFAQSTAINFWESCLVNFYKDVKFDGLWLDMNEPSNFCDGECPDGIHYQYYDFPLDFYDDLYYNPTHRPLEHRTLSMEALHQIDRPHPEFNYHNLYGFMQSKATIRFFTNKLQKRPLVLSSSTFPGSGRYVGHWVGDNYSSWDWMKLSLSSIFNFQLFGIPFSGADVCGFYGNTTVELCSRWMQLAAFYPLMRNHNSKFSRSQEPYTDEKLASVSKRAIRTRYTLSRYLYTSHMRTVLHGGLYFKPLLFDFSNDPLIYTILETTFMIGSALKVTPILEDQVTLLTTYFPNSDWYDLNDLKRIIDYNKSSIVGQNKSLSVSLQTELLAIHLRGGNIIMMSDYFAAERVTRIEKMRDHPLDLIIACHEDMAIGYVYFDNDETMKYKEGEYWEYEMKVDKRGMKVQLIGGNPVWKYNKIDETIEHIKVLGISEPEEIKCVKMHNKTDGNLVDLSYEYKADLKLLLITARKGQEMKFSNINTISWRDITC